MRGRLTIDGLSLPTLLPGVPCRKVLCWVESVVEEDRVVRVAQALAALGRGVCHVVMGLDSPRRLDPPPENGDSTPRAPLPPELIGRADSQLAALYGRGVATMVLPGHPVEEVRRFARNRGVDLVVIGAQGLAVEREYDARVADDPPCAVMTLVLPPNGENGRGKTELERPPLETLETPRPSER